MSNKSLYSPCIIVCMFNVLLKHCVYILWWLKFTCKVDCSWPFRRLQGLDRIHYEEYNMPVQHFSLAENTTMWISRKDTLPRQCQVLTYFKNPSNITTYGLELTLDAQGILNCSLCACVYEREWPKKNEMQKKWVIIDLTANIHKIVLLSTDILSWYMQSTHAVLII